MTNLEKIVQLEIREMEMQIEHLLHCILEGIEDHLISDGDCWYDETEEQMEALRIGYLASIKIKKLRRRISNLRGCK